eukprot:scaffold17519_cov124-Isochrysis_galbana.AAC.4
MRKQAGHVGGGWQGVGLTSPPSPAFPAQDSGGVVGRTAGALCGGKAENGWVHRAAGTRIDRNRRVERCAAGYHNSKSLGVYFLPCAWCGPVGRGVGVTRRRWFA